MIKPTIGRVMWYWPNKKFRREQPMAAIVTWVHDDNMVNLFAMNPDGSDGGVPNVPIVQDGSPHTAGDSHYCEWMPYQKGQAAKTEAAEAAEAAAKR